MAIDRLEADGWRVAVVWECALKGRDRYQPEALIDSVVDWLRSSRIHCEVAGTPEIRDVPRA